MENMWQFKKVELNSPTPKEILKEQADLLPALTGDMVYASVTEANQFPFDNNGFFDEFMFSFQIKSKFLAHYQFRVLTVSHTIPVYPVKILLDESIQEELQIIGSSYIEIKDEKQLKDLLRAVLSSNRIGTVIGSIIRLSK